MAQNMRKSVYIGEDKVGKRNVTPVLSISRFYINIFTKVNRGIKSRQPRS